jgi:hypothetical protein
MLRVIRASDVQADTELVDRHGEAFIGRLSFSVDNFGGPAMAHCGYMKKRSPDAFGFGGGRWQKRWCVLAGSRILYFADRSGARRERGYVPLDPTAVTEVSRMGSSSAMGGRRGRGASTGRGGADEDDDSDQVVEVKVPMTAEAVRGGDKRSAWSYVFDVSAAVCVCVGGGGAIEVT